MPKRDYQNDYPSVTDAINVLRKIGLENWFKLTPYRQIQEESEKGKLIGTQIHEGIHSLIQTGEIKIKTEYSEEVTNALKGFVAFRKAHPEIKLKNSEMAMTNEVHKYNMTLDCLAENPELILMDWKTGKAKNKDKPDIYNEYKYQVAAYVKGYNIVNNANIEKAIILALAKDKIAYNDYIMEKEEIDLCFNEIFLHALAIYYGQRKLAQLRKE